ncbi:hypothetical protein [Intrasporangium flavum]|uniref:hypothetical protein n=1 Tax=Intrasporangium flavum TaxID=1428657 RepID=UPI00096F476D|nr:hypothetical protein [Intrasporangium flavum]
MGDARSGKDPSALRRYGAGVVLPLALVAAAGWAWTHAPDIARPAAAAGLGASASRVPAAPRSTPTPGQPAKRTPRPTATRAAPSGPGITEPGVHLAVSPLGDGSLDVSERVVLPSVLTRLPLRPPDVSAAGLSFRDARPVATDVQLTVDGQPVPVDGGEVTRRVVVLVGRPASVLELRYVLTGSTRRSVPSTTGRALAAVAPLVPVGTAPVVVTTTGKAVRNLSCPRLSGDARSCSDGVPGAMSVRTPLRGDRSLVVLQLDLPRP